MQLNIKDPRAAKLARALATRLGTTITEATIAALQAELDRQAPEIPLEERIQKIVSDLHAKSPGPVKPMTREETDALWD